jgi:hypothetical protein
MVANAFIYDRPTVMFGTDDITCHLQMATLVPTVQTAEDRSLSSLNMRWAARRRTTSSIG